MKKKLLSLLLLLSLFFTFIPQSQSDNQELQEADKLFLEILKDAKSSSEPTLQRYKEILNRESNLDKGAWVISDKINLEGTPSGLWTSFKIDIRTDGIAANAVENGIDIKIRTPSTEIDKVVDSIQDELDNQFENEYIILVSKKSDSMLKFEVKAREEEVDINENMSISAVNGIFGDIPKFGKGLNKEFKRARELFKQALEGSWIVSNRLNLDDAPKVIKFRIDARIDGVAADAVENGIDIEIGIPSTEIDMVVYHVQTELNKDLFVIRDPAGIAVKLRDAQSSISKHLRAKFSSYNQQLLKEYDGSIPLYESLRNALDYELNKLVESSLYDKQSFSDVELTEEIRLLLNQNPEGDELTRLNRLLLAAAYPDEIVSNPRIVVKDEGNNRLGLRIETQNEDISISTVGGIFGEIPQFARGRGYLKRDDKLIADPRYVAFGIAYAAFKLTINNNLGSSNVPYALYRLGDILLEQARLFEKSEREDRIRQDVIPTYKKALGDYSQHSRGEYVLFWLGQFQYDRGNIETSEKYYQKLIQNYQNQESNLGLVDNAQFMISLCKLSSGDINRAKEILRELANNETVLGFEAISKLAQLEPPESVFDDPIFRETIKARASDPISIKLILDIADRLFINRQFDKAIDFWNTAIKQSGERLEQICCPRRIWFGLGKAYLEKAKIERKAGQIEQANENLKKSLKFLDQFQSEERLDRVTRRELNLLLASINYYKDNYDETIKRYEAAAKELPLGFDEKYKLVRAYVEVETPEKAIELLKEQIDYIDSLADKDKLQMQLDRSYRALVDVFLVMDDYQAAVDAYEKIQTPRIKQETGKILRELEKLSGLIGKSK